MIPYFLYFIFSISLLFINKKWIPIFYSTIWFVFVGLRDGIGTDYYGTLISIERSYIDIENPMNSFIGYNLVDAELMYKIISTIFYYSKLDIIGVHILIAFIETLLIFFLLKKIKHKKLLLIYFVTVFTLHFPMNAERQGLSLLLLIFALNYFESEKVKRMILIFFSLISHYASIPIILLSSIKIKSITTILISIVSMLLIFYFFIDLIKLRWDTDDISGYTFKGYGIKLIVGAVLLLMINYFVIEKKFLRQENIIIIGLMLATYIYNPFGRYYHFYATLVLFSNLFIIDNKKIGFNSILLLLTFPLLFSFSIWLEISRFVPFTGGGEWIPYKSLISKIF